MKTTTINGVEYVETNQAAAMLGLSARTLINARSEGRPHVPYIKHLGRVLYRLADVEALAARDGR
ncbi:hypothetical protein C7C45_04830 [Micromonospora arborensis]|uniref:Helix-turn-helix domain-containing protein n=1 Tax=Micromonospora arborensis TaxID=2116518 RepID=A0A318P0C1_9ACTN|nr:helix-turn-helix domain-containing protein [Micromonospora arborensis]PYC75196.1 hypothetical protein C7C45_04830 [Micromonospora arborensis]